MVNQKLIETEIKKKFDNISFQKKNDIISVFINDKYIGVKYNVKDLNELQSSPEFEESLQYLFIECLSNSIERQLHLRKSVYKE